MPPGEDEAAVRFYGAILGLDAVPSPEARRPPGGVWFRDGRSRGAPRGRGDLFTPAHKAHPAFLVRGLETLRERIEAAGYRVTDTVQMEGYHRVYVRDPFGNRVELIEPA